MVQTDSRGIQWLLATGEQNVIAQSRNDPDDLRWSRNYSDALCGFEVTLIGTFDAVSSGGHCALKHWGPNHSGDCGYEESGECCCWYDTGMRHDGEVQLQVERPHPSNSSGYRFGGQVGAADPVNGPLYMENIGQAMDGNTIGLKWIFYPIIPNGSAHNGGIRIKMYRNLSALTGGVPNNNWVIVYDFVDNSTLDILDTTEWWSGHEGSPYEAPEEQEIEVRVSGGSSVDAEMYGGGVHVRRLTPADVQGAGQGCPAGTHYNTATGTCVPDDTSCPAGEHWDYTQMKCVLDSVPPPPPPAGEAKQTDLKLFLSGGYTNTDPKKSLGGHPSTTEFLGTKAHQILDLVTTEQMQSTMTDYHLLYLKNTNNKYTFNNIKIFIYQNTINPYDSILIGLSSVGKNYDEYPLLVDTDTPPNVTFTAADTTSNGLYVASLGPNERIGIWIKRIVNAGSPPHRGNIAKLAFDFTPSGTPSDPNVPPPTPPEQCEEGQHWDYDLNECVDDSVPPNPPPPSSVNFSIAVVSDMMCNNDWENIYDNLKAHNPVRIFCTGDFMKDGSCMIDSAQDTRDKWIITLGNHDTESSGDENEVRDFGRFPSTNYYSTTFNNVGVLVFDFNGDTTSGSQASFMQQELTRLANNPAIEWIFVLSHGPFYSTESDHGNETDMREFWHPKFDTNKVDAMFNGHNHTKEVTSLVRYNSSDSDNPIPTQTGGTYSYNRGTANHGMLFIQTGSSGDSTDSAGNEGDFMEFTSATKGYVLLEFTESGRKCTFKHMNTSDNVVYQCNITHRE